MSIHTSNILRDNLNHEVKQDKYRRNDDKNRAERMINKSIAEVRSHIIEFLQGRKIRSDRLIGGGGGGRERTRANLSMKFSELRAVSLPSSASSTARLIAEAATSIGCPSLFVE